LEERMKQAIMQEALLQGKTIDRYIPK